mmetsp:Transcript_1731/g.3640  ORF Transcript_1731/g.3640 Transcript_1731/m.3640 type:complete len:235 (-) Transcript_1731:118-822(-)
MMKILGGRPQHDEGGGVEPVVAYGGARRGARGDGPGAAPLPAAHLRLAGQPYQQPRDPFEEQAQVRARRPHQGNPQAPAPLPDPARLRPREAEAKALHPPEGVPQLQLHRPRDRPAGEHPKAHGARKRGQDRDPRPGQRQRGGQNARRRRARRRRPTPRARAGGHGVAGRARGAAGHAPAAAHGRHHQHAQAGAAAAARQAQRDGEGPSGGPHAVQRGDGRHQLHGQRQVLDLR